MSANTQALAVRTPVIEFFTELNRVNKEFAAIKPSALRFWAVASWSCDRIKRIQELIQKHAGLGSMDAETLRQIESNELQVIDPKTVKEVSVSLVKATCAEKLAREKMLHIVIYKIFKFDKGASYMSISFVERASKTELRITKSIKFAYHDLSILTDAKEGELISLTAIKTNEYGDLIYVENVKFHVHSESEVEFLFEN